jgi:hypothetical protein
LDADHPSNGVFFHAETQPATPRRSIAHRTGSPSEAMRTVGATHRVPRGLAVRARRTPVPPTPFPRNARRRHRPPCGAAARPPARCRCSGSPKEHKRGGCRVAIAIRRALIVTAANVGQSPPIDVVDLQTAMDPERRRCGACAAGAPLIRRAMPPVAERSGRARADPVRFAATPRPPLQRLLRAPVLSRAPSRPSLWLSPPP